MFSGEMRCLRSSKPSVKFAQMKANSTKRCGRQWMRPPGFDVQSSRLSARLPASNSML